MYGKKMCGYILSPAAFCAVTKGLLDSYSPPAQESRNYKNWVAALDIKTCLECRERHGQIYRLSLIHIFDEVPLPMIY